MKLTSVILAGGQNKRMNGNPKWQLYLNNERILDRSISKLNTISKEILIVTGGNHKIELANYNNKIKIFYDKESFLGPLNGILTALENSNNKYNFIIGSDMPFFSIELAKYMYKLAKEEKSKVVIPIWKGSIQPLHGVYTYDNINSIKKSIINKQYRVKKWIENQDNVTYLEEDDIRNIILHDKVFFNMNTLEDYNMALKWVKDNSRI